MSYKCIQTFMMVLWLFCSPSAQAATVNINKADAPALVENLEGIGPKKAAAIVAYRKLNGGFKTVDDLLNVKGIGEKTLKKNRGDISLDKGEVKARVKKVAKAAVAKTTAVSKVTAAETVSKKAP